MPLPSGPDFSPLHPQSFFSSLLYLPLTSGFKTTNGMGCTAYTAHPATGFFFFLKKRKKLAPEGLTDTCPGKAWLLGKIGEGAMPTGSK
jgi:hypothetical protein